MGVGAPGLALDITPQGHTGDSGILPVNRKFLPVLSILDRIGPLNIPLRYIHRQTGRHQAIQVVLQGACRKADDIERMHLVADGIDQSAGLQC
jgi:hypothetical protein